MFQLQKTGLGKDQGARGRQDARVRGVGWAAAGRGWGWRRVCWAMRPHPVVETNPWPHPRPRPAPLRPAPQAYRPRLWWAASFDDVIAITGYSIFSSLAITGQGNVAWLIASGPLQVVFGIVGGLLGGLALGCTRLFCTSLKTAGRAVRRRAAPHVLPRVLEPAVG